jgi:AhpC/TSA antioxidant enzyme
LDDFYRKYFKYPLYRDVNLDFYRSFGDGKITDNWTWSTMLNPFKIAREMKKMGNRLKEREGLEGNYKGEGLKTGGIIIFDKYFQPKFMYPENVGSPLDVDGIIAAVNSVRAGGVDATTATATSESNGDEL